MKRQIKGLNYDWYFSADFQQNYLKSDFDFKQFSLVNIPHTMKELPIDYFNEQDCQFTGTYFKEFEIIENQLEDCLDLEFMGIMNKSTVYLNNQLLIVNEGGYTPFKVKINDFVKPGTNTLKVIVNGEEINDIPPFGNLIDYLPFSGIYREVNLVQKPKNHIQDLKLFAEDINIINQNEMLLNIILKISNDDISYRVKSELFEENKMILENLFTEEVQGEGIFYAKVSGITRWSIDLPKLYNVKVKLVKDGEVIDCIEQRFGFRTVLFTENGFLLNNEKIKLMGLNRHQSYPYIGYAAPRSMQEMDAEILKDLGCNIVRTSHYMQSDYFISKCDELGILVFEEIPGWNYIGNEHFKDLTYKNLETMINHHFNHPSICLWGVRINESKDDDEFYQKTNEIAKRLDPTRQTGGVRNFKKSHLLEDVYTYNDFSHSGDNPGLESPKKVSGVACPYLVTEYNGHMFPTKKTDSTAKRVEHSLRHLNVIEYNHYYDNISGAIGWCLADYNTHFQFGSNDRICHHGVLDIHRLEKYAAYAYKSQKAPQEEVVLFVANNLIPGDYDQMKIPEIVVYTNCDYLKVYRNDQYIKTYYGDFDNYEYLPHSPIIIDDLIGDLLVLNENYSIKDAKRIKKLLLNFNKYGIDMPLKVKLSLLKLMIINKMNFDEAARLFVKYLANQESEPVTFKFEGYIDDELVKTTYRGHLTKSEILIKPDRLKLNHSNTYDMVRVVIEQVDQFQNILDYGSEVVTLSVSDGLEVVGPKVNSLKGGSIGLYLKTTGLSDKATLTLMFNNYSTQTIDFDIKMES